MPKFTYIGETKDGTKVEETVDSADRFGVYEVARQSGHTVTSVSQQKKFSFKAVFNTKKIEAFISRVSADDLVLMTRNLGAMLKAGLPLSRSLSVIERQSKNPKLKQIVSSVREGVQKGDQFHEALGRHNKVFDDLYVSMVRAGEESGGLAESLKILSIQMERASNLRKKIRGAMIYPTIVLSIMVIIGILMMVFVMLSITDTFKKLDVELPFATQMLIAISDFMAAHTLIVISGLLLAVMSIIYFIRTHFGKIIFHWVILHIPVIGNMTKETNAARTSRTLSSLLTAGVEVIHALNITKDVLQNVYYKPVLEEAAKRVEQGRPLSEIFVENERLYPVFVGEMTMVGEETGQIGEMFGQLADFYENEVEQKTKDLSTIIEPILMVVIGGTVGLFALAMITPIYSISDSIG